VMHCRYDESAAVKLHKTMSEIWRGLAPADDSCDDEQRHLPK
jgi:hypothetical protein